MGGRTGVVFALYLFLWFLKNVTGKQIVTYQSSHPLNSEKSLSGLHLITNIDNIDVAKVTFNYCLSFDSCGSVIC